MRGEGNAGQGLPPLSEAARLCRCPARDNPPPNEFNNWSSFLPNQCTRYNPMVPKLLWAIPVRIVTRAQLLGERRCLAVFARGSGLCRFSLGRVVARVRRDLRAICS
ncbi:hypothetical protein BaRGS_00030367 [Batillaria attramentaria]|uniref:Uncharacterized protein n=1 Tax=Batillaria attramentaria TaxID=370345 RepID=A0ABD0JV05_9CAEN